LTTCQELRRAVRFRVPTAVGIQSQSSFPRVAIELEFRYVFSHEAGFSGTHVLSPVLCGLGTCVFWRSEAEELSIQP
jgi:hypothetical protein